MSWTDNSNNEEGFALEWSLNQTVWTTISLGANITEYAHTGLTNNTWYYYRIRAFNMTGLSGYSNTAQAYTGINP